MQLTPLKSRKNESNSHLYGKFRLACSIRGAWMKEKKMSTSTAGVTSLLSKTPSGGG